MSSRLSRRQLMKMAAVVPATPSMRAVFAGESPDVRVAQAAASVDIDNGLVRLRVTKRAAGIGQEYAARAEDGSWTPIIRSFRFPHPRPDGIAPLYSAHGVAVEHRLLVCEALGNFRIAKRTGRYIEVVLEGRAGGTRIEQSVALHSGDDFFHVEVGATLDGEPPRLEYLLATFVFARELPDFVHAPHLKRAPDDVIGDRSFRAPALVLQKQHSFAALVPDLDILNTSVVYARHARPFVPAGPGTIKQDPAALSMPTAIDLELQSGVTRFPVFSYGFLDYITEQHVFWRHENRNGAMVRELSGRALRYGFDLFVSAVAPPQRGYQRVSRFLWNRYGTRYFARPRPQVMPLDEYANLCYPAAFAYRGDTDKDYKRYFAWEPYRDDDSGPLPSWLEFEIDGTPAGGVRSPAKQWYHDIQFMAWWNNVRDAIGMYWWGRRLDPSLVDKARRIVNLALTAPQNNGMFPAVYRSNEKRWIGGYWKFADDFNSAWTFPPTWEPAKLPHYWDFSSDFHQAASASKTGVYLLRYRRLCEDDPRIVPYLRRYAEFLLEAIGPNGCVPAWFTGGLRPVPQLRSNSEGGIHCWFLCELFRATREAKYVKAAQRMAEYLLTDVIPEQRWFDFETFYSCAAKPENFRDVHTGQVPRNTLSMMWAIDGLVALYEATGNAKMLTAAEQVADYIGFYQAVWQPHFITTAYAFGGQCTQNTDGEWLAMHHTYLAESLVRLAQINGRQDLYERGVAALRASFAIVGHPRLAENGVFRHPMYPVIEPESIDHEGMAQVNLRSGFDWAEGGGLAAAAEILQRIGGAFVDFKSRTAAGVDGVHVKSFRHAGTRIQIELENQLAALRFPYEMPYAIALRIAGLPPGQYQLVINQGKRITVSLPSSEGIRVEIPAGRRGDVERAAASDRGNQRGQSWTGAHS